MTGASTGSAPAPTTSNEPFGPRPSKREEMAFERIGHGSDGFCGSEHVVGVATVIADAGDFFVNASNEVAAAASRTSSVVAAVPADADALAFFPNGDAGPDFVDDAGNFVARRTRISDAREEAVFDQMVAEADAAGLHADADISRGRLRDFALLQLEIGTGLGDYGDFHLGHGVVSLLRREVWDPGPTNFDARGRMQVRQGQRSTADKGGSSWFMLELRVLGAPSARWKEAQALPA